MAPGRTARGRGRRRPKASPPTVGARSPWLRRLTPDGEPQVRPVLVGPSTSAETPRSMVSTRPRDRRSAARPARLAALPNQQRGGRASGSARPCARAHRQFHSRGNERVRSLKEPQQLLGIECKRVPGRCGPRMPLSGLTSTMRSKLAQPTADRRTRNRPDTTASEAPGRSSRHRRADVLGLERGHPARSQGSARSALALERAEIHVARPSVMVRAEATLVQFATLRNGAARRMARRSDHSAASSLRRSCASSAPPWKENERCTVRPETGSTPTATRISHAARTYARGMSAASPRHAPKNRDECRDMAQILIRAIYPFVASTLGLHDARSEGFEPPTF